MVDGVGTTHHVRIGDDHFLTRAGSYRKFPAPLFGSRFTTGDPDYNNLGPWQHWVQTCWVGGFGAEEWSDDAMFDEGAGVDTSQHEVMLLTRDLGMSPEGALDASGATARRFIVFNDELYVVNFSLNTLWRWDRINLEWIEIHDFTQAIRSLEVFNDHLIIGTSSASIYRMSTAEAFTAIDKPGTSYDSVTPYTMRVYRGLLYVAFGKDIWRLKTDWTWDGSTVFYTAEDANYLTASETHLGHLYFASQNGLILRTDANSTFEMWRFDPGPVISSMRSFDGRLFISVNDPLEGTTAQEAVLYQFTGAAVTELKRWGKSGLDVSTGQLRAYGGKLYFGAGGLLGMGEAEGFGVAAYEPAEDAYHMVATNRDGTTYTGGTEGVNWTVDDVVIWRGWLWAAVRGHGIFRTLFTFRDASRYLRTYDTSIGGALTGPENGGWYTSSDFDGGTPGLEKLWHAVKVDIDLPQIQFSGATATAATNLIGSTAHGLLADTPLRFTGLGGATGIAVGTTYYVRSTGLTADAFSVALTPGGAAVDITGDGTGLTFFAAPCAAVVEYSLDGGVSWGMCGGSLATATIGGPTEIGRVRKIIPLQGDGLRGSRFKYRISLNTLAVSRSPALRGVTIRYLPIPEPNWQWQMTLVLSDRQQLIDGTTQDPNITTKLATLRTAFRDQELLDFEEPDGTEWATDGSPGVLITSMEERIPYIGPTADGDLEYEVTVTLLEVVEDLP